MICRRQKAQHHGNWVDIVSLHFSTRNIRLINDLSSPGRHKPIEAQIMFLPVSVISLDFKITAPCDSIPVRWILNIYLVNVVLLGSSLQRYAFEASHVQCWVGISCPHSTESSVSEADFSFENRMVLIWVPFFFTADGRHGVSAHYDIILWAPCLREIVWIDHQNVENGRILVELVLLGHSLLFGCSFGFNWDVPLSWLFHSDVVLKFNVYIFWSHNSVKNQVKIDP